ncbi:MAG: tetratricopeptide repeat protein [Calditrichaeota bacterium]|nr:MAG: tetratricopeptide repeat protein [Calditrichota bacterium]
MSHSNVPGMKFMALFLSVWLSGMPVLLNHAVIHAQVRADCRQQLKQALAFYNARRFDRAIGLLEDCLENSERTIQQAVEAHRLLIYCYLGKKQVRTAGQEMKRLLQFKPDYQPHPLLDKPAYIALYKSIRRSILQQESQRLKSAHKGGSNAAWYLIGGSLVAAGIVTTVVITSQRSNKTRPANLPGPPQLPKK